MCGFKTSIMSLKLIFTWWNRQTFGTFLKTLFLGKFVGSDDKSGVSMPNFMKLSKSLGFSSHILNQEKDLNKNLKKIIKSSLPTVCEIKMPSFQQLVPRVQTQMNKDGSFEPSMIDNMYPFLKKSNLYKIRKNLLRYDS